MNQLGKKSLPFDTSAHWREKFEVSNKKQTTEKKGEIMMWANVPFAIWVSVGSYELLKWLGLTLEMKPGNMADNKVRFMIN